MEKVLSREERIRKAEEIYKRRLENNKTYKEKYNKIPEYNIESIKIRTLRKVLVQTFACIAIYLVLYVIENTDIMFSDNIKNNINNFLAYDVSISAIYEKLNTFWNNTVKGFFNKDEEKDELNKEEQNQQTVDKIQENTEQVNLETVVDEISEAPKTQEEMDIDFIRNNYNIIWPLNGVITSKFGNRTPTDIVSSNHKGIDIGADTGTDIKAAMDGIVTIASTEGDYGKHLQINNNSVSTLYAHCSKLCATIGSYIKQGEKIAEVGSTGKATGPHLHFEIRIEDRAIDPELIL